MAAYEVELKFPLKRSPDQFRTALDGIDATPKGTVTQEDIYFSHPSRDFRDTDEALRIRAVGNENYMTYKGPLLDETTKTRQEIEVLFEGGKATADQMWAMLRALGFRDVRRVRKQRQIFHSVWESRDIKIAVDDVEDLGMYVELETIASQTDWEQAREAVLRLAEDLDLRDSERRSYLRMLVDQDR